MTCWLLQILWALSHAERCFENRDGLSSYCLTVVCACWHCAHLALRWGSRVLEFVKVEASDYADI
jgi:hypothetical protein